MYTELMYTENQDLPLKKLFNIQLDTIELFVCSLIALSADLHYTSIEI